MPLLTDASVADKAKIEPKIGPMHGVQPNAKADPTTKGNICSCLYNL